MQALQSSIFAAAQGRRQAAGQRNGDYPIASSFDLQPSPQAFFTPDYFDSLRPPGVKREGPPGMRGGAAGAQDAAVGADGGLAAGLAHDAGNLLSALSLYSELLACPEVLAAKHRHYASDLKLLAERSGKLIDRLVALGAEVDDIRQHVAPAAQNHSDLRPSREHPALSQPATGRLIGLPSHVDLAQANHFAGSSRVAASRLSTAPYRQDRRSSSVYALAAAEVDESSNLVDVLVGCGGVLSTLAGGALEVTMGSQAGLPVAVRQEALERILVNLVKNAALAVRRGGSIRIQVGLARQTRGVAARRMALTVDDSGCGMSAAKLAELSGANGSSAPIPDRSTGSGSARRGIGLQVVRELVQSSGGTLRIESREGVGTRIEIEWPTLPAAAVVPAPLRAVGPAVRARPATSQAIATDSGIVDRMEMVDEDGLTAAERELLTARSNRPVMAAESIVREAVTRRHGIQPATGHTAHIPLPDRPSTTPRPEAVFQKSSPVSVWAGEGLHDATLDRSFAGSLNRSLDRQRLREQQKTAAENEGAIAC